MKDNSISITNYGAAGVIGGNKTLLEDKGYGVKIMLDFGLDFKRNGRFFSDFLQARKSAGLTDLIMMNIIPKMPGLYRPDMVEKSGHKTNHPIPIDYLLESHPHFDHIACVSHLHPDIKLIGSKENFLIQQAIQESGTGRFEDFIKYKEYYKKPSELEQKLRPKKIVKNQEVFKIKGMTVEAWRVDHSIPGAMAYICHTSKGPVVYTGDFRLHGHHNEWTKAFLKRLNEIKPLAIIGEGTNIHEPRGISEKQVYERIAEKIKKTEQLVIGNWPARDLDRLISFYMAAKESGRKLAITPKQFYILKLFWENHCDEALTVNGKYLGHGKYKKTSPINKSISNREIKSQYSPKLEDVLGKDIVVYMPRKKWGQISEDKTIEEKMKDYSASWTREIIAKNIADEKHPIELDKTYRKTKNSKEKFVARDIWVNADDIRNNQGDYVVFVDNYSMTELNDLRPKEGSTYIYSKTEPFDIEMELGFELIENWCEEKKLEIFKAHCSGHAGGSQLMRIYKKAKPEMLVPIHTEHPEMFKKLENKGIKVIVPDNQYPLEARQPIIL